MGIKARKWWHWDPQSRWGEGHGAVARAGAVGGFRVAYIHNGEGAPVDSTAVGLLHILDAWPETMDKEGWVTRKDCKHASEGEAGGREL